MAESENPQAPRAEPYVYVRERASLATLLERIAGAHRVAMDTEADSLHNYFEKVCLIQLSLEGEHYLIDPLADLDLGELAEALAETPLILHGADYDLRMMRAALGFRPRREVFDTMIAAQLLGIEQIGLAALIEKFFGVRIGKEGQKSDWSRRPLSEKQLGYAVNDTRFLERLADRLGAELSERGRLDWHSESCRAMVEATGRDSARDPEEAWRIKGAGRLSRRQLAYLRELWRWRDEHARRANLPPFKVFGNEPLLELLRWAESHSGAPLGQGPKLPRNITGSRLTRLEEALARAAVLPPAQWPEHKKFERRDVQPPNFQEQIDAVRGECARIAAELGITASTLAPRAALETIVRTGARTVAQMIESGRLLRWQAELIHDAVERCFQATEGQRPSRRSEPASD